MTLFRVAFALVAVVVGAAAAGAQEKWALPQASFETRLGGSKIEIDYDLTWWSRSDGVKYHVAVNLRDVRSALRRRMTKFRSVTECGDSFRVKTSGIEINEETAVMWATVSYEHYDCITLKVPNFTGLKVETREKVARTRAFGDTKRFCVEFKPRVISDSVQITKDRRCPDAKSGTKTILPSGARRLVNGFYDFADDVEDMLEDDLDRALLDEFDEIDSNRAGFEKSRTGDPVFVTTGFGSLDRRGVIALRRRSSK
ncbi:MAG: hypothetical protein QNJ16_15610 [Rhodobacter sp.]|nr:hypothetical protein [Rhodobacter sp.]